MGNFSYGYKPRLLTVSDQTFKLFVWHKRIFYFLKTPPHSSPAFSQYVNQNWVFIFSICMVLVEIIHCSTT